MELLLKTELLAQVLPGLAACLGMKAAFQRSL
jgi:hypothetical protein